MANADAPRPGSTARAAGRARRRIAPREALARLHEGERDPLGILQEQNDQRVADLIGLRTERMAASAFTFYRGTAALMAADLGREAHSGLLVASCGDAHVSNFGFYASPQRTLLFDLNDFDEAAWAPWEWDVKRLVTSVIIAGRATDRDADVVVLAARGAVLAYLDTTRAMVALDPVARFFTHFDPGAAGRALDAVSRRALKDAMKAAARRTGDRAAMRLTERDEQGRLRFRLAPPAMAAPEPGMAEVIADRLRQYLASAAIDIRMLLRPYAIVDVARRAVGVGSVGTRCYVVLLSDDEGHSLVLQVKEAGRSVLEQYGGASQPAELDAVVGAGGQGARVVGLQRILQAYSDPFLGHLVGSDAGYFVRQLHDMKGSIEMDTLADVPFGRYAEACARVLARAHAQSGRSAEIAGYAGKGVRIAGHLVEWSLGYAERARTDYESFR